MQHPQRALQQQQSHQQHLHDHDQPSSRLLDLPDESLAQVFAQLAGDARSCCSAARAHSRLRQAVAEALRSIELDQVAAQDQLDSLAAYLAQHGRHATNLDVAGAPLPFDLFKVRDIILPRLTNCTQLQWLSLAKLYVQLGAVEDDSSTSRRRRSSHLGALYGLPHLTQLRLVDCVVVDHEKQSVHDFGRTIATNLTGLRHLHLCGKNNELNALDLEPFSRSMLPVLAQLTSVTLAGGMLESPWAPMQQHITCMSQPRELHISCYMSIIRAGILAGLQHLTLLEVNMGMFTQQPKLEAAVLADVTAHLQHLYLNGVNPYGRREVAGAALLAQLAEMQQLTRLELENTFLYTQPEPHAFAALTASSGLRELHVRETYLSESVWEHVFAAGRVMPALIRQLTLGVHHIYCESTPCTHDVERLVCCCPALQRLLS